GKFVGLALDELNEDGETEGRMDTWIEQLKQEAL
ncbi:MAG: flavodoxin, partial [Massilibacteroides sp.]|nr:flavodoxin [Massilibacteroides sp.]